MEKNKEEFEIPKTINDVVQFLKDHILECDPKDGYCVRCDAVRASINILESLSQSLPPMSEEEIREWYLAFTKGNIVYTEQQSVINALNSFQSHLLSRVVDKGENKPDFTETIKLKK